MITLGAAPAFSECSLSGLEQALASCLRAQIISAPPQASGFLAQAHHKVLNKTALWHCSYQTPIRLKFPDGDNIRLQLPLQGAGRTLVKATDLAMTAGTAGISEGAVEIEFGKNYRQLVWLVDRAILEDKWRAITGCDLTARLSFAAGYRLTASASAATANVVYAIVRMLEKLEDGRGQSLILTEMEQALMTAFLVNTPHDQHSLLEGSVSAAAPWQVRRAESFLETHWDKPVSIEELSTVTGISVRSLFRSFRQYRGYTPMEFLRSVRLRHAKAMLLGQEGDARSVTEVAFACGFSELSSFSKSFSSTFGISPSVLRRQSIR